MEPEDSITENDNMRFDAENFGRGMKEVREAHRYCGGHDFADCPMWAYFKEITNKIVGAAIAFTAG